MTSYVRRSAIALCTGAMLVAGTAGSAGAAVQNQDGLVNVAIGDITVEDVNIGAVVGVVANVCIGRIGPVAVLAEVTDRTGQSTVVCRAENGPVRLVQN